MSHPVDIVRAMTVEAAWEVQAALEGTGIPVFPVLPGKTKPYQLEVWWREVDDPAGFVALAARTGAPVLYAEADSLTVDEIEEFGHRVVPLGAAGAALLEEVRGHFGELFRAGVAFVIGGVLHVWGITADWRRDLEEQARALEEGSR